jgi:hypothetical protein
MLLYNNLPLIFSQSSEERAVVCISYRLNLFMHQRDLVLLQIQRFILLVFIATFRSSKIDPRQFFSGIVCTASSFKSSRMTAEDQELLYGGIVAFGGQYLIGFDEKQTTHLVTMEFNEEIPEHIIQILPHWFSDCFTVQRKVPTRSYTFPDPEVRRNLAETR